MTQFRPCIDLHSGQVKQIVGGTLSNVAEDLKTNYVSRLPASHYAELYQKHNLRGGHVVKLGPGNEEAALEAVRAWPNGLQVAGGITDKNAQYWIEQGAEKVSCSPQCIVIHASILCIGLLSDCQSAHAFLELLDYVFVHVFLNFEAMTLIKTNGMPGR
jgi:phosphoribosylformimino-5-aminoimidazole carboxamide ribonucleotide (ProFAR) isomerase